MELLRGLWQRVNIKLPPAESVFSKIDADITMASGRVLYKKEEKEICLKGMLNDFSQCYETAKSNGWDTNSLILFSFRQAFNSIRCFFKNQYYETEKEYRVALTIPIKYLSKEQTQCEVSTGFFKRGNVLIPYLDYPFNVESLERITLNPLAENKESPMKLSIQALLEISGIKNVDIYQSCIPMRKYN